MSILNDPLMIRKLIEYGIQDVDLINLVFYKHIHIQLIS